MIQTKFTHLRFDDVFYFLPVKHLSRQGLNRQHLTSRAKSTPIRPQDHGMTWEKRILKAEIAITNNVYLCEHSQKTKTLCCHGWRFLYIYCFRLSEASSFRRKKFSMRNKLNDVYAFPDRIKSVLRACSEGKLSWIHFHFASNKAYL